MISLLILNFRINIVSGYLYYFSPDPLICNVTRSQNTTVHPRRFAPPPCLIGRESLPVDGIRSGGTGSDLTVINSDVACCEAITQGLLERVSVSGRPDRPVGVLTFLVWGLGTCYTIRHRKHGVLRDRSVLFSQVKATPFSQYTREVIHGCDCTNESGKLFG